MSSKCVVYQFSIQKAVVLNGLIEDLFTFSNTTQSTPVISIGSSYKGVRPRYAILIHTHILLAKSLHTDMLLPEAVAFT